MADINLIPITSAQNPKVKTCAAPPLKKHRDRDRHFLIEGVRLLQAALRRRDSSDRGDRRRRRTRLAGGTGGRAPAGADAGLRLPASVMAKCTGTDTPPPVFAVVTKPRYGHDALLREGGFVVALDGVRDPGNAGTLIRAADAVGADPPSCSAAGRSIRTIRRRSARRWARCSICRWWKAIWPSCCRSEAARPRLSAPASTRASRATRSTRRPACWLLLGNESNGLFRRFRARGRACAHPDARAGGVAQRGDGGGGADVRGDAAAVF